MYEINGVKIIFAQPFSLDAEMARKCIGPTVVLDVGFNTGRLPTNLALGSLEAKNEFEKQFNQKTGAFIETLDERLVKWVDHHPHEQWKNYENDERFVLADRDTAPACLILLTEELVKAIGKIGTIVCHGDTDGILMTVKLLLKGKLPYKEAEIDAIAADTRKGVLSQKGQLLEKAIKADISNNSVRMAVVNYLTTKSTEAKNIIKKKAEQYAKIKERTLKLAEAYKERQGIMFLDCPKEDIDLTQLLLIGQEKSPIDVAMVICVHPKTERKSLTVAGSRNWNFVSLLGLPGGMPNRVTISIDRLEEAINAISNAPMSKT
ncbi:hypothetical protein KAR26_02900 [Candidatus Parcubacteria bacterium]|nr:hypothetical protein [Candidatus Parcubacteria bacterium]